MNSLNSVLLEGTVNPGSIYSDEDGRYFASVTSVRYVPKSGQELSERFTDVFDFAICGELAERARMEIQANCGVRLVGTLRNESGEIIIDVQHFEKKPPKRSDVVASRTAEEQAESSIF